MGGSRPRKTTAVEYDWTEEELATLKKEWAAGTSASFIANLLPGRTRNAVMGKVHRLKLTPRKTVRRKALPFDR
jgi:GcrA cell cycle regulator